MLRIRVTTVSLWVLVFGLIAGPAGAIAPDAYEYDDAASSARDLAILTTQSHNFHDQGDVDWVRVYAYASQWFEVETTAVGPACDTYIQLYRSNRSYSSSSEGNSASKQARCRSASRRVSSDGSAYCCILVYRVAGAGAFTVSGRNISRFRAASALNCRLV